MTNVLLVHTETTNSDAGTQNSTSGLHSIHHKNLVNKGAHVTKNGISHPHTALAMGDNDASSQSGSLSKWKKVSTLVGSSNESVAGGGGVGDGDGTRTNSNSSNSSSSIPSHTMQRKVSIMMHKETEKEREWAIKYPNIGHLIDPVGTSGYTGESNVTTTYYD